jgi:hypothetical protein
MTDADEPTAPDIDKETRVSQVASPKNRAGHLFQLSPPENSAVRSHVGCPDLRLDLPLAG